VEIRFDHTIYKELDYALDISSRIKNRAIFTLRSKDEGGYFDGDHSEHVSLLKKMAGASPMLLDIEISIIKKDKEMRQFLKENKIPNLSSLLKKFEDMSNYSNYVKLVTTARTFEDNFKLLSLYDNNTNTKLIAFAMGEHGILSRLLCILYGGSPFTYASLDNPLAPGQLDIVLMKKIYDRIGNNLKSK
jgi:3-dehydroquinate dehydratase-1